MLKLMELEVSFGMFCLTVFDFYYFFIEVLKRERYSFCVPGFAEKKNYTLGDFLEYPYLGGELYVIFIL